MHLLAYSVSAHFANYGVAVALAICLDSVGDIADAIALLAGGDAFVERLLGCLHQLQHLGGDFAHGECVALVAVVAVKLDDAVKTNDVTLAQGIVGRKSVNDYLIDLDTECTGETAITETSGTTAIV